MNVTVFILLAILLVCAVAVSFTKSLYKSVLILMGYSSVMSVIWLLLESPDLAVTEAAVGAGITTVLFFVTFKRIGILGTGSGKRRKDGDHNGNK